MINASKLHKELEKVGIPIHGCSCDGRIDFKDEATDAQKALAKEILAKHNPYDYQEERRKAYAPIGDQLDMIYWDKVNGTDLWVQHIAEVKLRIAKTG